MIIRPEVVKKSVRSFVIRTGRMTPGQESATGKHWVRYGLHVDYGLLDVVAVFNNTHPLILEIGFGMGDSLLAMALQEPQKNFIGVEVHAPGVGRLLNEAARHDINNLRVFCADALDVLALCIPPQSLSRLQVYFPDPWHKTRHHKRRIVQQPLLDLAATRLASGGVLHLATDWWPYALHMLRCTSAEPGLTNLAGEYQFSDRPSWRPETKFERRGQKLGHGVWDLLYEKQTLEAQ